MFKLREFIEKYIKLTDGEWKTISELYERIIVERNDEIVTEGKICKYSYFIEDGLFRSFILIDGNDITNFFIPAPSILTSRNSFLNQVPANENIQAIEKSILWRINLEQSNELMKLDSWNRFVRKFLIDVQTHVERQLIKNKTETAEIRYKKLLSNHPELVNRIPSKYLATYLGVAPQSLSRIKKNIFKDGS